MAKSGTSDKVEKRKGRVRLMNMKITVDAREDEEKKLREQTIGLLELLGLH